MSQHVIICRVDMNGLFIKKTGTFGAGAKWPIDEAPLALIQKAQEGITFHDPVTSRDVRAISFMTTAGNWVGIEDAYIPRLNIGKKPSEPEIHEYEKSKKARKTELKTKEEPPEVDEDDLDEEGNGAPETPEAVPVPEKDEDDSEEETEESTESEESEEETPSLKKKILSKIKLKKKNRG
jgi:hypothetical protein